MYALYILNDSCRKDKKHSLIFPGLGNTGEPPVAVSAICVDGEFVFNIVDIAYVITQYANGKSGNTIVHVRDIITANGGRGGFGKVFWFRRGGTYADIMALHSIAKELFSSDENACAFSKITYHAAYGALMDCGAQDYKGVGAQKDGFKLSDFIRIQPHSFEVSKYAVSGVPMPDEEGEDVPASVQPEEEQEESSKIENITPKHQEEYAKPVEQPVRFDGLYAFDKLLSMLVGGRKLVLTLEVK